MFGVHTESHGKENCLSSFLFLDLPPDGLSICSHSSVLYEYKPVNAIQCPFGTLRGLTGHHPVCHLQDMKQASLKKEVKLFTAHLYPFRSIICQEPPPFFLPPSKMTGAVNLIFPVSDQIQRIVCWSSNLSRSLESSPIGIESVVSLNQASLTGLLISRHLFLNHHQSPSFRPLSRLVLHLFLQKR